MSHASKAAGSISGFQWGDNSLTETLRGKSPLLRFKTNMKSFPAYLQYIFLQGYVSGSFFLIWLKIYK